MRGLCVCVFWWWCVDSCRDNNGGGVGRGWGYEEEEEECSSRKVREVSACDVVVVQLVGVFQRTRTVRQASSLCLVFGIVHEV